MTKVPLATLFAAASVVVAACLPAHAQTTAMDAWLRNTASTPKAVPGSGPGGPDSRSEPLARTTMAPRDGAAIEVRVPNQAQAQPQSQSVPPAPRGQAAEQRMTECLNDAMARRQPLDSCRR
jgi:hypothetical protein